ncbi:g5522 [Coccomyxa elongata]
MSGNMRGTMPWMAPELFPVVTSMRNSGVMGRTDDQVTEKVDVFSFGICLREIWTLGEQVYPGLSLPAIFTGVVNGTLRPALPPDAPQPWRELMDACCSSQPSRRPSFSEIAANLKTLTAALAESEAQ